MTRGIAEIRDDLADLNDVMRRHEAKAPRHSDNGYEEWQQERKWLHNDYSQLLEELEDAQAEADDEEDDEPSAPLSKYAAKVAARA